MIDTLDVIRNIKNIYASDAVIETCGQHGKSYGRC
jgi:hypothetical protein